MSLRPASTQVPKSGTTVEDLELPRQYECRGSRVGAVHEYTELAHRCQNRFSVSHSQGAESAIKQDLEAINRHLPLARSGLVVSLN